MNFFADRLQADFAHSEPVGLPSEGLLPTANDPALLWRVLDEMDYGLILATPDGRLLRANHLGRIELARGKFLRTTKPTLAGPNAMLQTNGADPSADLLACIRAAARGRRQMLNLYNGADSLAVACVSLSQPFEAASHAVLLMLARQVDTANLALGFFARSHKLTAAEEGVLRGLCNGLEINEIAAAHGVVESTVRSQVRALRDKTGCSSVRLLLLRVAALPPVVPVSPNTSN